MSIHKLTGLHKEVTLMKTKHKYEMLSIALSLLVLVAACFFPAYYTVCEGVHSSTPGYYCLIGGPVSLPFSVIFISDPNENWHLIWFANVPYALAIYYFYKRKKRALAFAALALAVGCIFETCHPVWFNGRDSLEPIVMAGKGAGYYLWLASLAILLAGIILRPLFSRSKPRRMPDNGS